MTIGDILAIVSLVVLIVASWIATIVFATYLAPSVVSRARQRLEASPKRCVSSGAFVAMISAIVGIALASKLSGPWLLLPILIVGSLLIASSIGSAAVVQIITTRFEWSGHADSSNGLIRTVRGATVYCLAGLFPVAGWVIITPLALLATIGAVIGRQKSANAVGTPIFNSPVNASAISTATFGGHQP